MKLVFEFARIAAFCFVGEVCHLVLPLPIPASVYGLMLLLAAETVCKVFRITNPIAKGIGIGTASHAVGTSKALEIGEVEGAMSGLSVAVAGIMTAVLCPLFSELIH